MMNKLLYILILGGGCLLLNTACKKEKLFTYNASDNIYFNYIYYPSGNSRGVFADSVAVTFSFRESSVTETTFAIPIAVTGVAKDYDRLYNLAVDPASTAEASKHYELPVSFVLRAGRTVDSLFVKLKRTADIKTVPVRLMLRLNPNDQFQTQLQYKSKTHSLTSIDAADTVYMRNFKIIVSDMLAAGPYWDQYSYYFGEFSEKKVRLMNQIIGMPLDFWSVPPTSAEHISDMTYYGGFTFRYLADQAYAGNIIFEANGITRMTMGFYYR